MKKVININFQGRVVPIEESAFEQLKNYIDSLERYFSNEEGKEEIINDIESRIAELFSEILKKGSPCIVEDDVNNIINMMGRVEDFEAEEVNGDYNHSNKSEEDSQKKHQTHQSESFQRGRFYRDADDKFIGGVCSGLANYLGVDPVLIRIFAVVFFTFFFWIYLLLWLIVPSKSIESNVTKRLFRDVEDKWIGGVCSGIAKFFNASSHLVRLAFGIPFAIWLLSGRARELSYISGVEDFPSLLTGSFGFGLAFIYLVLWIALPVAKTTSDKLEMRGQKIDINNIQKKVQEELETFKSSNIAEEMKAAASTLSKRAKEFGNEIEETANKASKKISSTAKLASDTAKQTSKSTSSVIGGVFKLIGMFIVACFVFFLFASILGITVGVFMAWPYLSFVIGYNWHAVLFFVTIIFFLFVPLIALVIYFVKRLSGTKTSRSLRVAFVICWTIGWISLFILIPVAANEFSTSVSESEKINIEQPKNTLTLKIEDVKEFRRNSNIIYNGIESNLMFLFRDTLVMKSNSISIIPSRDSSFALNFEKESRGRDYDDAFDRMQKIETKAIQNGDEILVSNQLLISKDDKFRGQEFNIILSVPVGRDIILSNDYDRNSSTWVRQQDRSETGNYRYRLMSKNLDYNKIYRMTESGLKSLEEIEKDKEKEKEQKATKSVEPTTPKEPVRSDDTVNKKIRGNRSVDTSNTSNGVYEYPSNR